jgi:hypothetical protein
VELAKDAAAKAQASRPAPNAPTENGPTQGSKEQEANPAGPQDSVPEDMAEEVHPSDVQTDESFETSAPHGNLAQPPNNTAPGIGAIDKLYAPSDASGVDCHKITVKTGSVAATANISKEQYETLKPLVDAGIKSVQACMQLDVQQGSWTFSHLVDRTGEALTHAELDSLRAEAQSRLESKSASKPAPSTPIPGAPGDVRIPGFTHLPTPQPPTPKTPEQGL